MDKKSVKIIYCNRFCSPGKKCERSHEDCYTVIDQGRCAWVRDKLDQLELFLIKGNRQVLRIINPDEEGERDHIKRLSLHNANWDKYKELLDQQREIESYDIEKEED